MLSTRARRAAVLSSMLLLVLTLVPTSAAAGPQDLTYLALGDSLPYGWDVVTQPFTSPPASHVGYPETLADRSPFVATNAACPGETSASFIDRTATDNGCGFVAAVAGLKVDWAGGSQLEFAEAFLADNPDTALVSLQLGANDLFLCQRDEGPVVFPDQPGCSPAEFGAVLGLTAGNLATSMTRLRLAGYDGTIVLVGYYALDYADPAQNAISQASRDVLLGLAGSGAFGDVVVADGYAAFEQASRRAGGDPCAAGLLLPTGGGTCDVHTTPAGDRVLAQAVHRAIDLGGIVSAARRGG